ncbi:hypothetical protein EDC61_103156 [Sulfuritortus calidifontis]|uniref:Lipoprotein n=1 Tax=Sulfuritortus calidifontis TaxID=1914471 RepID=A0A4R3JX73_9PROT|nr:hypothetical protein [Sulfuritortus calidifontis]TCS73033.1 hypothetical protein EDC61_103156 [Sulfuritortus calidifontis]
MTSARRLIWLTLPLLAACAGSPSPPDWRMNAADLLERYQQRWLEGDSRTAEINFAKARSELARTGRLDLAARAELIGCATRLASLDLAPCTAYDALSADATADEAAYARFLAGDWQGLDAGRIPAHYTDLVRASDAAGRNRAAQAIADPAARLIASALLLKAGEIAPETIGLAGRTASEQGWRRPLLAWLQVSAQRAEAAGDSAALAKLKRQMELVTGSRSTLSQPGSTPPNSP